MVKILYLPKFAKQYSKLPQVVQKDAEKKEKIFRKNPFDGRLKTHKLKGRLKDFYSFSVSYSHRIIFDFESEEVVRFYLIGNHDIYE